MTGTTRVSGRAIGVALVALALAIAAAPASARPAKDGDKRVRGVCTQSSTSKLKASREDGGVELEFEVDQNRVGVRWQASIHRNGRLVRRASRVTRAPSGSFELRVVVSDRAGTDRFRAVATSPAGERCRATLSY